MAAAAPSTLWTAIRSDDLTMLVQREALASDLADQADMVRGEPLEHRLTDRDGNRVAGDLRGRTMEGGVRPQDLAKWSPAASCSATSRWSRCTSSAVAWAAASLAKPVLKNMRASFRCCRVCGELARMCRAGDLVEHRPGRECQEACAAATRDRDEPHALGVLRRLADRWATDLEGRHQLALRGEQLARAELAPSDSDQQNVEHGPGELGARCRRGRHGCLLLTRR